MRSRYSAYVLRLRDYLLATWHPATRPAELELDDPASRATKWLGLDVRAARAEGDRGEVEFVARYRVGGASAQRLHERSRFERVDGRWYYRDGEFIGRR
jgi:SEC-C motif-containing protein